MASEKKLRDALVDKNLYFAAAQPRSPPCWSIGMFKNPTPTPETKTWMVLGGADDYTAAEPCVELGKKLKQMVAILRSQLKRVGIMGLLRIMRRNMRETRWYLQNARAISLMMTVQLVLATLITNGLIRGGLINALKEAHILEETNLLKIPLLNFLKKLY